MLEGLALFWLACFAAVLEAGWRATRETSSAVAGDSAEPSSVQSFAAAVPRIAARSRRIIPASS